MTKIVAVCPASHWIFLCVCCGGHTSLSQAAEEDAWCPTLAPLRQGLSLALGLAWWSVKVDDPPVTPHSTGVTIRVQPYLGFYMGAGNLNSDCHVCAASVLAH